MDAKAKRCVSGRVGVAIAVLFVAFLAAVARVMGASWQQVVWGALGLLASALVAAFVKWLVTGGQLRLDRPE